MKPIIPYLFHIILNHYSKAIYNALSMFTSFDAWCNIANKTNTLLLSIKNAFDSQTKDLYIF